MAGGGRHVAVLSWRDLANPDGGGSEVFLAEVTAGLAAAGWRVTQLSASFRRGPAGAPRRELVRGVRLLRRGGRLTVFARALWWHRTGRFGDADVVLDVHNGMPFLSPLATRRPVVVLVHHVHREQWPIIFPAPLARLGWWLESRAAVRVYRDCDYLAVSEHTRAELAALGVDPARITVVANGTRDAPADGAGSAHPSLCVLGRLVPHKRVELAIDAVARLRPELPGLTLDVVGAGDWEGQLRAAAERAGVADAVTFHGHVAPGERDRLLRRAWVLAMPSVKEGWGLAVMEAAVQGTPAVGFRGAGGLAESILDGRTGLLAADGDDFVAAVRRLLTDRDLRARLGGAARDRARTFGWDRAVAETAKVLAQAAEPSGPARPRLRAP